MDPKRKKIIGLVAVVGLLIAGYFLYEHFSFVETDNAQVEAHSVMIAAKVGGYVTQVAVDEGQQVKKGELLASIDERDYQNTLQQMMGEKAAVQARLKDAEKNYSRLVSLFKTGAVSQQQFDAASASFSDLKSKNDAVAAQVAQAQLNLEQTKILAPFDGVIAKRSVEVGQLAGPGVPLFGFVSSESRWVVANFKETDLENIKLNAKVDVDVDAITKKTFKGHVESISSATGSTFTLLPPDNATGNFTKVVQRVPVKIQIDNLSPEEILSLKAGLSSVVKVHLR
jgi:membrane fusion protein (multidrug efflux system)